MLRHAVVKLLRGLLSLLRLALSPLRRFRHRERGPRLLALRGFASPQSVCFIGRVTEDMGLGGAERSADYRRRLRYRLRDAYRLLISRPVPEARVEISYAGQHWETKTDEDGLLFCRFDLERAPAEPIWQPYQARLLAPGAGEAPGIDEGEVFMRPPTARRIIISDLDDTVIYTGVANKLMMLWRLFATAASERVPFPGVAELYRGLHDGANGHERNPMLYVSRSPWSLYPTLEEFFQLHGIPTGPVLLLRDWGITLKHPLPRKAPEHKDTMIDTVLQVYPDLPVVLVGDSGQHDPEVYAGLVERHPRRIAAVYIRDLEQSAGRTNELAEIGEGLRRQGVDFVSGSDSSVLAAHASERGWMSGGIRRQTEVAASAEEA